MTTAFVLGEGCNKHCRSCGTNPAYHDVVIHYLTNQDQASSLEDCNAGSCYYHECGQPEEPHGGDAIVLSERTSGDEILELIRAMGPRVRYNAERESLQLYCTQGVLVANIPVTVQQAEALDRAELSANH